MLTIGITICDRDYENCENILKQIEQNVLVEHEVIIIDNREKCKDNAVPWSADYAFGYNAYQFSARAKIIEKAKGDYIWFVDGDDSVGVIDSLDYTEDIVVFSFSGYPVGEVHLPEKVIKDNIFSYETSCLIKPVLWNKFIKKDLFNDMFPETKIVTNEDTLWLYNALKNAGSIKIVDKIIYHHTEGLSNTLKTISVESFKELLTGYSTMLKLMKHLTDDDFYNKAMYKTNRYLLAFVPRTSDIHEAVSLIRDVIPKGMVKEALEGLYSGFSSEENYKEVIKEMQKAYDDDFPYLYSSNEVVFSDGHKETVTFKVIPEFK